MELREVVRDSVAAWRKARHPRLAAVADWATARAIAEQARPALPTTTKKTDLAAWQEAFESRDELDLPRLLAAVATGKSAVSMERLRLIATTNDPRAISWILRTLEAPPFRAQSAMPFFRACCEILTESNDPRVRPALEDLAGRYKGIIETSVGDLVSSLLARTVKGLDQVKPGPLPAALEKKCAEWEKLFDAERTRETRATSTKKAASANDDELLAAIYAAPEDDGPRQVYADALTERGDARGEFISLQLARARGRLTQEQKDRENELRDTKRLAAWALPLSAGGDVRFGRGFPETLQLSPRTAKKAVGHEALRTLTRVEGLERIPRKVALELLSSEQLRGARHVGALTAELVDALQGALPWSSVGLHDAPREEVLERFPSLRALELTALPPERFDGAEAVESVKVVTHELTAGLLPSIPNVRSLELVSWDETWNVGSFAQLKKLERLDTHFSPPPELFEGSGLVHLKAGRALKGTLPQVIATLKKLRTFSLISEHPDVKKLLELLDVGRERRFEQLGLGVVTIDRPFTKAAVVEVPFSPVTWPKALELLKVLPRDAATRVVVRPWHPLGIAQLTEEQQAQLRASTKLPTEVQYSA